MVEWLQCRLVTPRGTGSNPVIPASSLRHYAPITQLKEYFGPNEKVEGLSPSRSTNKKVAKIF